MLSRERIGLGLNGGPSEGLPGRARWLLAGRVSRSLSEAGGVPDGAERVVRLAVPVGRLSRCGGCGSSRFSRGCTGPGVMAVAGSLPSGWRTCKRATSPRRGLAAKTSRLAPLLGRRGGALLRRAPLRSLARDGAEWAPFGAYRFVLPLRAARRRRGGDAGVQPGAPARRAEARGDPGPGRAPLVPTRNLRPRLAGAGLEEGSPGPGGWSRNVERALAAFSEGRLDKVVLARRTELGFSRR